MPPSPRESNPSSRSRTLADLTGLHHERFSPQPPADKRRDSCIVPRLVVVLHTFMPSRSPRGTPRLDMSASKKNQERHSGSGHGGHGLEPGPYPPSYGPDCPRHRAVRPATMVAVIDKHRTKPYTYSQLMSARSLCRPCGPPASVCVANTWPHP